MAMDKDAIINELLEDVDFIALTLNKLPGKTALFSSYPKGLSKQR